jgi:arginine deiminase
VSRHSSWTCDTSAWIVNTVSVHAVAKPAGRRDAVHQAAIYRHRPRFGPSVHARWSDELGERTRPAAIERLAARLFAAQVVDRTIGLPLP